MALVRKLDLAETQRASLHEEIAATHFLIELDGQKLVQINMIGRPDREHPGKVSQTIQLDEDCARQLSEILKSHFRFK